MISPNVHASWRKLLQRKNIPFAKSSAYYANVRDGLPWLRSFSRDYSICLCLRTFHIFDPRRNFQTQGFTGRAATTTMHDATETGVSISGIFQAADDFAVLGWWNAYDYFNHLRCRHLPRTDLSGLKLEFDIEYDHALDGSMRLDAAKYPSVSWDAMTFVTGKGDVHEVPLLDHATVVCGGETPASASSTSPARRSSMAGSIGCTSISATPGTR